MFSKDNISHDLTYRDIESRRGMFRNRRLQHLPSTITTKSISTDHSSSAGLNNTWDDDDVVEQIYL